MNGSIDLASIKKGKSYRVLGFHHEGSAYSEKLHKMGFVAGTTVERAPVRLNDPIVVQIRGSRIALRKNEAREIFVEEVL